MNATISPSVSCRAVRRRAYDIFRIKRIRPRDAGRKAKSGVVREPMQLSLDIRTINTLNAMGINKSELFEELLKQYEPFLLAWSGLGNEMHEEDPEED